MLFPGEGSHLERYARQFSMVEVNSSFYRPHRRSTYVRWAESTPPEFSFAVKLPKQITHEHRLRDVDTLVDDFTSQVAGLGEKLGVILVQLPPSLEFDPTSATDIFSQLRQKQLAQIACEPRHPSWFDPPAEELLRGWNVSRVAADPAIVPAAAEPGGDPRVIYIRWHGSPRMYYSKYSESALGQLADSIGRAATVVEEAWLVFDNTAEGAAAENALQLAAILKEEHLAYNASVSTVGQSISVPR